MSNPKTCLSCRNYIDPQWQYCLKCGLKIDKELFAQIESIDYLLKEIAVWRNESIIEQHTEERLAAIYLKKREDIVFSLKPQPKKAPTQKIEPVTNSVSEVASPPVTERRNRVVIRTDPSLLPSFPTDPKPTTTPKPEEKKPIGELIADNIKLIFTISGALFVTGILLYYRSEIYQGLKQPFVQATMLALITLACLFTGWTLVRRTSQSIVGVALSIVGSLLVPLNPWLLVKTKLIADSGNSWTVALFCTALYAWTSYFLRERVFAYLALATGIITGWSIAAKVAYGGSAGIYAAMLMAVSIAYMLSEYLFKPEGEGVEFSREIYGRAFFHVAQVGTAICLLFYTPLMLLLPKEFIAARLHFDPTSYSYSISSWLALCAAFVYFYSAFTKRTLYFVYLGIGVLLWAETTFAAAFNLKASSFILLFALTALLMNLLSNFANLEKLLAQPLKTVSKIIAAIVFLSGLIHLVVIRETYYLSVSITLSLLAASTVYAVDFALFRKRPDFYIAWAIFELALFFMLINLGLNLKFRPLLMFIPIGVGLLAESRLIGDEWKSFKKDLRIASLLSTCFLVIGSFYTLDLFLREEKLIGSLLCVLTALSFARLSHITERRENSLVGFFATAAFLTLGSLLLAKWVRPINKFEHTLLMTSLGSLLIYLSTRRWTIDLTGFVPREEMREAFSAFSVMISLGLFLIASAFIVPSIVFGIEFFVDYRLFFFAMLLVIAVKELIHIWEDRSLLHTIFASLVGLSMVSTVVLSASIMTVGVKLILFLMLAISYLAISILLERRGVESKVWLTVEASGSITTAASVFLTLFLASYHSFGCLFASILGVGYFVAAHHFCRSPLSKTYPYAAIISLTASTMNLLSCYKITAWSEIAPIFTTLLIAYLLVAAYLKEGIYSRAFFAVAECLMPMVIIVTAISELDSPSTAFNRAFFFTAVGIFYMLSTNFYKKALTIYVALTAFAISLWNIAVLVDIDKNFFATLYAFAAIGLLMLSKRVLENRYSWAASSLLNAANTLLVTSIAGAILQSTASLLSIKGSAKLQVINMLMVTAVTGLFSIVLEQLELKKLCRWAAYGLACYTHFVFGLYLGYDIFRQAEFYGLPIGFSLIMIGYLQSQKEHRVLMGWFWLGSLMIASPLMLHSLQYRFIDAQPSSQHDLFTIIVSLVLIFVGIAKQFKAPTIVGSSCFLIEIASIIFSFVEWEQKWLSISMITIAVVIFSSSWAIYFFHKKNRLAEELKRQSRNVIEEFGKWR